MQVASIIIFFQPKKVSVHQYPICMRSAKEMPFVIRDNFYETIIL